MDYRETNQLTEVFPLAQSEGWEQEISALAPCTGMVQVRRRKLGSERQAQCRFLKQQRKRGSFFIKKISVFTWMFS